MIYARETLKGTYRKTTGDKAEYVVMTLDEMAARKRKLEEALNRADEMCSHCRKPEENQSDEVADIIKKMVMEEEMSVRMAEEKAKKKYDALASKHERALRLIEELRKDNQLLEEETERAVSLNYHFRRVSKQRGNKANGRQKKDGFGYAVLLSTMHRERVADPDFGMEDTTVDVWKTAIRTPYDAGLPLKYIYRDIRTDLIDGVLGAMGIERLQEHDRNGEYQVWKETAEDGQEIIMNGVYRWVYRMNLRDNCYEMELYHNKPIMVFADMRPLNKG